MPDILFVSTMVPSRACGGCLATLATLRALSSKGWRIHLAMCTSEVQEPCEEARALCRSWTFLPRLWVRTPWSEGLRCLLRYGYWPRYSPELWDEVHALLRSGRFDLLFLDHLVVAEVGRFAKEAGVDIPVVLREHNVESQLLRRALRHLPGPVRFLEALARFRRYQAIEGNLGRYCDLALSISTVDTATLRGLSPGVVVEPFPPPIDVDHYRPRAGPPPQAKELVFIGNLEWLPNLDGVRWFVEEVFEAVRARHPDAHLTVIGGGAPPEWLRRSPRVDAVGFVPDERDLVARARAVIVPIRFGSGVRMKMLNSLAMGKAVVSTRLGAEGIPVVHGESALLADGAAEFAEAVCTVLEDDACLDRLGRNGLEVCLGSYGPAALSERLDGLLRPRLRPRDVPIGEPPLGTAGVGAGEVVGLGAVVD